MGSADDELAVPIVRTVEKDDGPMAGRLCAVQNGFSGLYPANKNWEKKRNATFAAINLHLNITDDSVIQSAKAELRGDEAEVEFTDGGDTIIATHADGSLSRKPQKETR